MKSPFKQQIKFRWEKSSLRKKDAGKAAATPVFKPSLKRGKTLDTMDVINEFIGSSGLRDTISPNALAIYVRGLLKSMVEGVLTDGRSRRIDDFFTVRLDMKGTAESYNEPFNPRKHKFTINFQKSRRFSEKSQQHDVKIIGEPVCEVPLSRSVIKNVHSYGAGPSEVYIGRQIILEGKDLTLNPNSRVALSVDYPVGTATFACEISDSGPDYVIVESPRRFSMKYMRESVIGLTGEIILYLNDPRNRRRQAAHGSRFKVKFTRPPSAK